MVADDYSSEEEVKGPAVAKRARAASNVSARSNRSGASSQRARKPAAKPSKKVVDDSDSDGRSDGRSDS